MERWQKFVPEEVSQKDKRTDFLRAREKAAGHNISFCPFGCATDSEDLDPQGYCRHLVGFTVPRDGKHKVFHPLKYREDAKGKLTEYWFVDGKDPQKILPSDQLEQVSVTCRVYREEGEFVRAPRVVEDFASDEVDDLPAAEEAVAEVAPAPKPKRRGGRPKKIKEPETATAV